VTTETPQELAEELAHLLKREAAGEVLVTATYNTQFVQPPRSCFIAETITGRKYRVTITKEPQ
jgi:hypothetical protein